MKFTGASRIILLVLLVYAVDPIVSAQSPASDTVFFRQSINNAITLYHQYLGDQSGLYNGSQYPGYTFSFKDGGYAFFIKDPAYGTVVYDNMFYPSVKLLYDEIRDELVLEDSTHRIQLLAPRVAAFSIGTDRFIRVVKDSGSNSPAATGFYQLLYQGKISVLKKEIKKIREELRYVDDGIIRSIELKRNHYIKRSNVLYEVDSKNALFSVLKDHKKEVQQYIKSNKLSFRKDRDNLLIKVSAYYDQLTK